MLTAEEAVPPAHIHVGTTLCHTHTHTPVECLKHCWGTASSILLAIADVQSQGEMPAIGHPEALADIQRYAEEGWVSASHVYMLAFLHSCAFCRWVVLPAVCLLHCSDGVMV